MTKIIDLKELKVEALSNETLDLVSRLTAEIRKVSGDSFSFNDPLLLPRIRYKVKRLNHPKLTTLYYRFKFELLRSVKNGHFRVREDVPTTPGHQIVAFMNRPLFTRFQGAQAV